MELAHVRLLNIQEFAEHPVPNSECRSIAKPCAKYSLRQFSEATFSEMQTARNTKRWYPDPHSLDYQSCAQTVAIMFDLGYTKRPLADAFKVTARTIQRDLTKMKRTP